MAKGRRRDYQKEAQKWVDNTSSGQATENYKEGISQVTIAPGTAAVAKKDKMVNGFMESVNSGKWAENTSAVSLQEWADQASGVGAERLAGGVRAAQSKREAFTADFGPKRDALADQVNSMPDATPEQRDAKMLANARGARKLKYTRRRR